MQSSGSHVAPASSLAHGAARASRGDGSATFRLYTNWRNALAKRSSRQKFSVRISGSSSTWVLLGEEAEEEESRPRAWLLSSLFGGLLFAEQSGEALDKVRGTWRLGLALLIQALLSVPPA